MLVLKRAEGEAVVIQVGDKFALVRVADIRGRCVKLAVAAPEDVLIDREEVHEAKGGRFIAPHELEGESEKAL